MNTVETRLRPLRIAMFLQGIAPWVPVEKLFMSGIGFDPALVAVMAAAYAAVVPVMEIPSGILADRWSRRGVLVLAASAGLLSVAVGAVSHNVGTYIVSAMILGVYFALQSGTVDAVVYDTLLEEVGDSAAFERQLGRMHLLNSAALVGSAVAGGVIAAVASPRMTYVVTIPCAALAVLVLLRFREPRLHRAREAASLGQHVATTVRAITRHTTLLPIVVAAALGAMTLQMMFEFGPLWLVAAGAAAVVFGPYTAGMTGALGLGGLLAGRLRLDRPAYAAGATAVMVAGSLVLVAGGSVPLLVAAQVVMALVLVVTGIYLTRVMHDAVPSTVRAGVASGVSTLSWLAFLPAALVFGLVSRHLGVQATGWIVTASVALAGTALVRVSVRTARAQPVLETV
jgi:MFS family permease